jgi:peptide/nickel transport system substrate-binding protein
MALALALMPAAVGAAQRSGASPIYLTVSAPNTTITRNFNPFDGASDPFTLGDIYEPLMVITEPPAAPHSYPWLATGYRWINGNRSLVVTLRHGVRWSDGQPFTAQDVVFTFTYGTRYPVADQQGLWSGRTLRSVTARGDQVTFNLTGVDTTALWRIVSAVFILPQHIFARITNPGSYLNPDPVGTGPFAVVTNVTTQSEVLARNPYYWQPLAYDGIRELAFGSNDAHLVAMLRGDLDWTGDFVPNIQKLYVARDPAHFHYLYADTTPIGLYFNDERYPFSLPAFRKAISHAVDRQRISQIAEYGYELPADALGLAQPYPSWANPRLAAQASDMATYDIPRARSLLAQDGFTLKGGRLYDPRGAAISITLAVIANWGDWVLAMQIIERDLRKLGIDTSVKLMTAPAWFAQASRGELSAELFWVHGGSTPYNMYDGFMSKESYTPTGTDASLNGGTNWARYYDPGATRLLARFRQTTDSDRQHAAIDRIEAIFLRDLPWIPVMYGADWYTYSTRHFTGFPTREHFYADGSPNNGLQRVVVLTHLKPAR